MTFFASLWQSTFRLTSRLHKPEKVAGFARMSKGVLHFVDLAAPTNELKINYLISGRILNWASLAFARPESGFPPQKRSKVYDEKKITRISIVGFRTRVQSVQRFGLYHYLRTGQMDLYPSSYFTHVLIVIQTYSSRTNYLYPVMKSQ